MKTLFIVFLIWTAINTAVYFLAPSRWFMPAFALASLLSLLVWAWLDSRKQQSLNDKARNR